MFIYPAIFKPAEEGGFVITFPDVPEAITQAETKEEGIVIARDCLETALGFYIDGHRPIPKASQLRGKIGIEVSPMAAMKLMIHQGMIEKGVRKSELARRIGVHLPQIDRLLDLNHSSKFDQIDKALAALGLALVVDVRKAA
jgi:antitoxin HicB